jgi:16S rRNA (adenine1518-N6/adenine1519-N6)-dimethyltransferase
MIENIGQHFLIDQAIVKKMASFAESGDVIFEIGPGKGALTRELIKKGAIIKAIEIDGSFEQYLSRIDGSIELKWGSAIRLEWPTFDKIISSIPYNIIEPLMEILIRKNFKEAILLVGDKFAKEALASASDNYFGKLTLISQSFFEIKYISEVSKASFFPRPRVKSAIIRLCPYIPKDKRLLFFRELFLQRKKKIKNSLRESLVSVYGKTKNEARKAMCSMDFKKELLDRNIENISNDDFRYIYKKISGICRI